MFSNTNNSNPMTQIITFAHFKGGTGKTTSCLSVAGFLAKSGGRVLAIDLDPQANLTAGFGVQKIKARRTMHHVMKGKTSLKSIVVPTPIENVDLAPASYHLAHATLTTYQKKSDALILKKALSSVKKYDFVLVDLPPSNGHFIMNGVLAADSVVLVLDPSQFSLDGIESFQGSFTDYCKKMGFSAEVSMALVTRCASSWNPFQRNHGKKVANRAMEMLGTKVFKIPYSETLYESQEKGLPISHYKPESKVGIAYLKVAEELVKSKL
jgi:chromosome partitioning protein